MGLGAPSAQLDEAQVQSDDEAALVEESSGRGDEAEAEEEVQY